MAHYECFKEEDIELELIKHQETYNLIEIDRKANIFKTLGDNNRLRIMELLSNYESLCVYEISRFIDASVATTSHHLITLRNSGLITSEKFGKRVVYSLISQEMIQLLEDANELVKLNESSERLLGN